MPDSCTRSISLLSFRRSMGFLRSPSGQWPRLVLRRVRQCEIDAGAVPQSGAIDDGCRQIAALPPFGASSRLGFRPPGRRRRRWASLFFGPGRFERPRIRRVCRRSALLSKVFRRGSAKLAVLSQQGLQDSLPLGLGEKPEVGRNQAALAVEDDRIGEAPGAVAESAGEVDCFQSGHEHWVVDRHLGGRLAAFLYRIDGDPYNL